MGITRIKNIDIIRADAQAAVPSYQPSVKNFPNQPIPAGYYKATITEASSKFSRKNGTEQWWFTVKLAPGQVHKYMVPATLTVEGDVKYGSKEVDYSKKELLYTTIITLEYDAPGYSERAQHWLANRLQDTLTALHITGDLDIATKVGTPVGVTIVSDEYDKNGVVYPQSKIDRFIPIEDVITANTNREGRTADHDLEDYFDDAPF